MMKPMILALACIATIGSVQQADSQEASVCKMEWAVYRIRGDISGETSLTDHIVRPNIDSESPWVRKGRFRFNYFVTADMTLAGVKFKADENGWTWDGKGQPPKGGRVEQVTGPVSILAFWTQTFAFSVVTSQNMEFFEKRADGLFEHKVTWVESGVDLSATADELKDGRITLRDFEIVSKVVAGREPIEGVNLDVGAPIVSTEQLKTTLSLQPGWYYGLFWHTEGRGTFLIRLRVDLAKPPAKETPSEEIGSGEGQGASGTR